MLTTVFEHRKRFAICVATDPSTWEKTR